jgi:hypothetical protein
LYKIQLQSASRNAQINEEVAENNIKLSKCNRNYKSIFFERVYGGMLSAMSNKG